MARVFSLSHITTLHYQHLTPVFVFCKSSCVDVSLAMYLVPVCDKPVKKLSYFATVAARISATAWNEDMIRGEKYSANVCVLYANAWGGRERQWAETTFHSSWRAGERHLLSHLLLSGFVVTAL